MILLSVQDKILKCDEDRFGQYVSSEVTRDMLLTGGYPAALNVVAMWMIAVSPSESLSLSFLNHVPHFVLSSSIQSSNTP